MKKRKGYRSEMNGIEREKAGNMKEEARLTASRVTNRRRDQR